MLKLSLVVDISRFSQIILEGSGASKISCSSPKSLNPFPEELKIGALKKSF
jgi:hypothetical protein